MSHYHAELIFPPTDDIEGAVEKLMKPFDENGEDEDGDRNPTAFWDFYVIGGRFSGAKVQDRFDKKRMEGFYELLKEKKVTVSSLQCGKQELQPASQIPMVDKLWSDTFPEAAGKCPLFAHYNDQYGGEGVSQVDICTVAEIPDGLTCSTLIFADSEDGSPEHLLLSSFWNGVTWQDTAFNGKVVDGIKEWRKKLEGYKPEYAKRATPTDDWLVVTVDYHS